MLKTFTLKNGIKVATYNLSQLKSVYVSALVKGGALVEEGTKNGVAHFMEHMLVQGIPSFPTAETLSEYIESLAGTYGATTSLTTVDFSATVPSLHLEDILRITSEVFFEPLFTPDAIEKERRAVLDEITQKRDSTGYKINQFFKDIRYTNNSPLRLDSGGEIETVKALTRQDCIDYHHRHFLPKNTFLLISGKFTDNQLMELLNQYFLKYQQKVGFGGFPNLDNNFTKRQAAIREDDRLGACYIDISFPSVAIEAQLSLKLQQSLCLIILGRLRHSRLFKLLRYQKGLVYSINAGASILPGLGYGYIDGECLPKHLTEVLELIAQELKTFVDNGPTEAELDFVKNFLSNQWLMSFDHPSAIAGWIETDLLWRDRVQLPEEYISIIKDYTTGHLTEFMQKNWDFGKLNITVQGSVKNTAENRRKYLQIFQELT